jgi:hypothetical protein
MKEEGGKVLDLPRRTLYNLGNNAVRSRHPEALIEKEVFGRVP